MDGVDFSPVCLYFIRAAKSVSDAPIQAASECGARMA